MSEENATLHVRLPNVPYAIKFTEWQQGNLYHTVQFTDTDNDMLEAFVATGSTVPGGTRTATRIDSNLPKSGDNGVPDGWKMLLYSIQITVARVIIGPIATEPTIASASVPASLATLFELDRKIYFQFLYNDKKRFDGHLSDFPAGAGYHLVTQVAGQELAQLGGPTQRDAVSFVIPMEIEPGVSYKAPLQPVGALVIQQPVGAAAPVNYTHADIRVKLSGLLARPIS